MEFLEQRFLFSTTPSVQPLTSHTRAAARTVLLNRIDGSGLPLVGDRNTWIIFHGLNGTPASVNDLAHAVDNSTGDDQVLVVDWSQLAATLNLNTAVNNTRIVADVLAADLKQLGLSAAHTNLIAFSIGSLAAARLAGDLHASGGVNRFIAMEPIAPDVTDSSGNSYTPTLDLSADSQYSIAFHASGNYSYAADRSADDSILISNLGSTTAQRHQGVFDLFTDMTEANASGSPDAVSAVFSLTHIEDGGLPAWRKNIYSSDYEAVLAATSPSSPAPHTLQYRVNRFSHTVTINA